MNSSKQTLTFQDKKSHFKFSSQTSIAILISRNRDFFFRILYYLPPRNHRSMSCSIRFCNVTSRGCVEDLGPAFLRKLCLNLCNLLMTNLSMLTYSYMRAKPCISIIVRQLRMNFYRTYLQFHSDLQVIYLINFQSKTLKLISCYSLTLFLKNNKRKERYWILKH